MPPSHFSRNSTGAGVFHSGGKRPCYLLYITMHQQSPAVISIIFQGPRPNAGHRRFFQWAGTWKFGNFPVSLEVSFRLFSRLITLHLGTWCSPIFKVFEGMMRVPCKSCEVAPPFGFQIVDLSSELMCSCVCLLYSTSVNTLLSFDYMIDCMV